MPFLSNTVRAIMADVTVRAAICTKMDFVGGAKWYWPGFGPLRTADGQIWEGTSGLGMVSGLGASIGTSAPPVTFTMSGVDARVAALARQQSDLVKGRDVDCAIQFFGEFWQLLDFLPVWSGEMDRMTYKADGSGTYVVTLSAEGVWTGRSRPPYGLYTDADQQARFPGDRGLEQVGSLPGKTINWPTT